MNVYPVVPCGSVPEILLKELPSSSILDIVNVKVVSGTEI